jgi:hypothetical protein
VCASAGLEETRTELFRAQPKQTSTLNERAPSERSLLDAQHASESFDVDCRKIDLREMVGEKRRVVVTPKHFRQPLRASREASRALWPISLRYFKDMPESLELSPPLMHRGAGRCVFRMTACLTSRRVTISDAMLVT